MTMRRLCAEQCPRSSTRVKGQPLLVVDHILVMLIACRHWNHPHPRLDQDHPKILHGRRGESFTSGGTLPILN